MSTGQTVALIIALIVVSFMAVLVTFALRSNIGPPEESRLDRLDKPYEAERMWDEAEHDDLDPELAARMKASIYRKIENEKDKP